MGFFSLVCAEDSFLPNDNITETQHFFLLIYPTVTIEVESFFNTEQNFTVVIVYLFSPQSTQIDPEELFTKLDRIGKGSFGEVRSVSANFTLQCTINGLNY